MKLEKKDIEYFDYVINNLDDPRSFSVNNTLNYINLDSEEQRKAFQHICKKIKDFGEIEKYWVQYGKDSGNGGYFKLTDLGLELRKFKKGHAKFQKELKSKPLDWYKLIAIILTIIFGLLNVYQKYDYNRLKVDYDFLRIQQDSLNRKLSELNNRTIDKKEKQPLDTLKIEN